MFHRELCFSDILNDVFSLGGWFSTDQYRNLVNPSNLKIGQTAVRTATYPFRELSLISQIFALLWLVELPTSSEHTIWPFSANAAAAPSGACSMSYIVQFNL